MQHQARPSLANVHLVVGTAALLLVTYALLDRDAPAVVELFGGTAPLIAVLIWMHGYARRRRMAWFYDWGLLFWAAWPIVLPWYSVRLEGRRGWRLVARLAVLIAGPVLAAAIIRMMRAR